MSFSEIAANASNHSEANQKNFNLKPITPEGIFSFDCHPGVSCFNRCCHEIDVILTPVDILKIKTELNMSSDKFLTQYTTMQKLKGTGIPLVKLLMRDNSNGACIFLDKERGCSIYQFRPLVCRSYPLGLASLDPRQSETQGEGQPTEARFIIREDICMGHLEPKTWTLKEWMKDQGTIGIESDNKTWLEIVAKLKAMKLSQNQKHEISLFIMASYDLDTFWRFVFESSMLKRFKVEKKTIDLIRSDQLKLLNFAMMWLQFTLFGEGPFAEKLNVKK